MGRDEEDDAIERVEAAMTVFLEAHAAYQRGGESAPLKAATVEVDAAISALRALF